MSDDQSFSATDDIINEALKKQALISGYKQFATDYAASKAMQKEAEVWLGGPIEDR